jgi:hypothetical protein
MHRAFLVECQQAVRPSFGLALVLAGQPIAWSARGLLFKTSGAALPVGIILLGLLLLIRREQILTLRLYADPIMVAGLTAFVLVPVSMLSLLSLGELATDGCYAAFLIVLLWVLALTPLRSLRYLPETVTAVAASSSTLALLNLVMGEVPADFARLTLAGNNNPLIVGMVGGTTMIAALMSLMRADETSRIVPIALGLAFVAGMACVVLSDTRSVMLSLFVCLPLLVVLYPRSNYLHSKYLLLFSGVVATALVLAPAAAVTLLGPRPFVHFVDQAGKRLTGALNLFDAERARSVDVSSTLRIATLEQSWDRLTIIGHGISAQSRAQSGEVTPAVFPHLAYLQAIYDFGVVGGLVYLVMALLLPLAMIVLRLRAGNVGQATRYAIVAFVYGQADQFTHATPYSWLGLMPIVLVYSLVARPSGTRMPSSASPLGALAVGVHG